MRLLLSVFTILLPLASVSFVPSNHWAHQASRSSIPLTTTSLLDTATTTTTTTATTMTMTKTASPSFGQALLNFALDSPLWKHVMVPQARKKMQNTAEQNGIMWQQGYEWIANEMRPEMKKNPTLADTTDIPSYYQQAFHAYEDGNLSWQAAMELELASASVGARNVPLEGKRGEDAFRRMFEDGLQQAGATVPRRSTIVDLGCGTGISTRRLAQQWPEASEIIGIDMSPYFIAVGKRLLELQPKSTDEGGPWVSTITNDNRISYRVGDIEDTGLSNIDIVQLQFVAHELPPHVAKKIVDEAYRMVKPGGQFWMCEMDFEAPAYAAQRANPLLFSLIRATEPYLDEYADSAAELRRYIGEKFSTTKVVAATGRHFALVATKGKASNEEDNVPGFLEDFRFGPDGVYCKEDTHLKVWEDKQEKT